MVWLPNSLSVRLFSRTSLLSIRGSFLIFHGIALLRISPIRLVDFVAIWLRKLFALARLQSLCGLDIPDVLIHDPGLPLLFPPRSPLWILRALFVVVRPPSPPLAPMLQLFRLIGESLQDSLLRILSIEIQGPLVLLLNDSGRLLLGLHFLPGTRRSPWAVSVGPVDPLG